MPQDQEHKTSHLLRQEGRAGGALAEQRVRERSAEIEQQLETLRALALREIETLPVLGDDGERGAKSETTRPKDQRLQQAKDFAESVIDAIPDLLFELDGEGRYLGVWAQNTELLAAPEDVLISRTVHEILPPQAAGIVHSALREAAAGGYSFGKAYRLTLPSGERWFELSVARKPGVGSAPPTFIAVARDISERRRAEEISARKERDEREQRLSKIAANLPGFLYVFRRSPDGHFNFPYVSPGVRDLFGVDPDELASGIAPIVDLLRAEDRAALLEKVAISMRDMSLFEHTAAYDVPGHGERWITARSLPQQDADGSILWYGVMLDVSEQQRLKYQLNLSRFALDRVREAFFLIADDLRLVYVNDEACRALGFRRDELLALRICDIDPDDSPERVDLMRREMHAQGRCLIESRHRRRDGSVFPVEINATKFKYQGGTFTVSLVRDLTEQKRVEKVIAVREREFRTLAESLPDSIARYDRNGVATYINTALNKGLGGEASELIGKRIREWRPDGSFEGYARALEYVLATGQAHEIEIFMPDPRVDTGHVCQIRFVAERDEHGRILGVLANGRDISALKRSERELENSRRQLRGLIARGNEVREAERKRVAREVHDELGQTLTALQMNVARLARKIAAQAPALLAQVQETAALADKALAVTRNVAAALRPPALDLGIAAALEWLAERYSANTRIPCHVHIADGDIDVDENQAIALFRIAQESLTNVARHARASRVDLTLGKNGTDCVLKIHDDGVGFDERARRGNSFGLVGIRERAFILGGTVSIDSTQENGTKIVVSIPRHDAEPQPRTE